MIGRVDADTLPDPACAGSSQDGFTLVEVIVALALSALVVAFLAEGTGLLRHFMEIGRVVSAQDETLVIRDHLRRTIEGAIRGVGSTPHDAFAGVADTAVFTVPGDRLLEAGGPVRVTLVAVADGARTTLVETRAPIGVPDAKGRTRRLITGATQVRFAYFGPGGVSGPAWQSEWTDPAAGPTLVRIDLTFPLDDRRRWPPFFVFMPTGGGASVPAVKTDASKPAKSG